MLGEGKRQDLTPYPSADMLGPVQVAEERTVRGGTIRDYHTLGKWLKVGVIGVAWAGKAKGKT